MARTVGFFTDTTLCIGCKACEVACKEWNQLPGHPAKFGDGYDNNWVQSLTTNVPINLAGTTHNSLNFKCRFQSEQDFDYGWVLIKGGWAVTASDD